MNKKRLIYIGILFILTVIVSITYFSYAFLSKKNEYHGRINVVAGTLEYKIESDDLDNNSITLTANEEKEIELKITGLNTISSKYQLYTNNVEDVDVGYLEDGDPSIGIISSNGTKTIIIALRNNSDMSKTITFGVQGGFEDNNIILESNRVAIALGEALGLNDTVYDFDYTGNIQTFTVTEPGFYKLEAWGAQGGNASTGGKGGYTKGEVELKAGDIIYVVVGGQGTRTAGGYNGGGKAGSNDNYYGGGGATHISTATGTLVNIYNNSSQKVATAKGKLYVVAGGGGGGSPAKGGAGGGLTGVAGSQTKSSITVLAGGGTQTAGGVAGKGGSANGVVGSFGQGGNGNVYNAGGGGGLFGGGSSGATNDSYGSGGGGSGYVGIVSSGETIAGSETITEPNGTTTIGHSGNGYARVTYLGKRKIIFNANGGTVLERSRKVNYGYEIGELPTGTKEGKVFVGWYTDTNYTTRVDSAYIVNDNITLYAKYSYDLSFIDDVQWTTYHSGNAKESRTLGEDKATYSFVVGGQGTGATYYTHSFTTDLISIDNPIILDFSYLLAKYSGTSYNPTGEVIIYDASDNVLFRSTTTTENSVNQQINVPAGGFKIYLNYYGPGNWSGWVSIKSIMDQ